MASDFSSLAQQSTSAAAFEAGVLEQLARTVGFAAAFFFVKGQQRPLTTTGLDDETAARLVRNGEAYGRELSPVMQAALAARGVAVDTEVFGVQHARKARYYREIAATIHGQHVLLATIPWRGRVVSVMGLGRVEKTFSPKEVALVESLLPNLGVARAALGLPPWSPGPLRLPPPPGLVERWRVRGSRELASVATARGTLVVRDRAGYREMVARGPSSELVWTRARLRDPRCSGWPYADLFHLAAGLASDRSRALFVGCGGGVSLHQFASTYPGMALELVEQEPAVLRLALDWFDLGAIPNLTTHVAEGTAFIEDAPPRSWDVVVLDAYDTDTFVQEYYRQTFLPAVRRVLRPGGAVACNLIGTLGSDGPVRDFVSSCGAVFESVRVVPVVDADEDYARDTVRNVVVIAR